MVAATWLPFALLAISAPLQKPAEGRNRIDVRGQVQDVYYSRGTSTADRCNNVLFLPGDGGWRGFAIDIAHTIASWGYDVYSWDTKRYLEGFSGKPPLKETEVMDDFRQLGGWIRQNCRAPVTLVGWSEGAGLCLLAAASKDNKSVFNGLITLGLGEDNILAWKWTDYLSYLTKRDVHEPGFKSMPYLPEVSPLPLWMLQSTGDQYVSGDSSNRMFAAAREPKRYDLIDARNHRFDGNHDELFRLMKQGLDWMNHRN